MLKRLALVVVAGTAAWFALLRGLPVKLIRALDRRGGLASRHGARGYSRLASRFLGGFHARVAGDAAASLAGVAGVTVLDIGSGPGEMALLLARALPEARIVGLDPSVEMLEDRPRCGGAVGHGGAHDVRRGRRGADPAAG